MMAAANTLSLPVLALLLTGASAAPALAQNSFNVGGATTQGQPTEVPQGQTQLAPLPNTMPDPAAQPGAAATGFGPIATEPQPATQAPVPKTENNPELADYGIPPTTELHAGPLHGPTPTSVPGGQVITTVGLKQLVAGQYGPFLLLDILGQKEGLPGAIRATPAAQAGTFQDAVQGQYAQFLQQMTQGKKDIPIVVYCESTQCWMSYNAALRAINLGYSNVLWYRGGVEAWRANGGQLSTLP